MSDPTLFDQHRRESFTDPHVLARVTDPATSHLAAARVAEFAGSHKERILAVLRYVDFGATQSEIAAMTGLLPHQTNKRLNDLHKDGLAEPTDAVRVGHAGRNERVWILT